MKNVRLLIAFLFVFLVSGQLFAGDPPAGFKVEVTTTTVAELKAKFGDNIVLAEGMQLDETATVIMAKAANPCDAYPEFDLCGPVAAEAGRAARAYANACCCEVLYGWECCDPSSGPVSYLAIASPNHCN